MSHPALDAFGDLEAAAHDPHVAGCERCRADLRAQQEVRALLAGLPDPGPAPPDVVHRIEATLRGLVDDGAPTPVFGPAGTVVPIQSARRARHRRPLLAVAAAALVLVGGGFGLTRLVPDGGSASSAAGASMRESGQSRSSAAPLHSIASGTRYTRAALSTQVDAVLASTRADGATPRAGLAAPAGPLAGAAGIAQCLSALGAPAATPLLVDVATFDGTPAAVVVLPAGSGGREIWVVSPSCRPGQDGTRYFTTTH